MAFDNIDRKCRRKYRFTSEANAELARLDMVRVKGPLKTLTLTSYSCEFCGGFHLGRHRFVESNVASFLPAGVAIRDVLHRAAVASVARDATPRPRRKGYSRRKAREVARRLRG